MSARLSDLGNAPRLRNEDEHNLTGIQSGDRPRSGGTRAGRGALRQRDPHRPRTGPQRGRVIRQLNLGDLADGGLQAFDPLSRLDQVIQDLRIGLGRG